MMEASEPMSGPDPSAPGPAPEPVPAPAAAPAPEPALAPAAAPAPAGAPAPAPAPAATTASGLVYADVPNRAIAYIIDVILVAIVLAVVTGILGGMGLRSVTISSTFVIVVDPVASLIYALIGLVISGGYFIYTWTSMRATVGMRVLGMQIGNAGDGKTLTMEQAIRRYFVLAAPSVLAQVLQPIGGIFWIVGLAAFAWFIFLIYTTAQSPTKQGYHDVFANTQVVKALKAV
jgi:uncharacterized RDD family membrane protein YckC